jgi:DNA-binding CsgD family transcriptional regulator
MKARLVKTIGLLIYLAALSLLFRLDWRALFQPGQLLLVALGMGILTASQYRKGFTRADVLAGLKWNAVLAGFLTTLASVLSSPEARLSDIGTLRFSQHLLPLLYGSIFHLLLGIPSVDKPGSTPTEESGALPRELTYTETAERVFGAFSLTRRERHVAQKLLQDLSNKEIAADLYISEATVKKHIQNIYQKFGAASRASFLSIYYDHARKDAAAHAK